MQGDDHTDIVSRVKGELEARRVDLSGPCGAFAITRRVAWALRDEGAGLLSKPAGNNCEGFAADYVVYKNGQGFDCLGDAGGANIPQWSGGEIDASFPDRWRAPVDTGDVLIPRPGPTDPPPATPPATDDAALEQKLFDAVERIYEGLHNVSMAVGELNARLDALQQHGIRLHF